ncbi:MAG: hypothetical protein RL268_1667 [Pseudomonadota bacterium]|jgi:hypothetical protein
MSNQVTPIQNIAWQYAPAKRAGRFSEGSWTYPRPGYGRINMRLQEVVVDEHGNPIVIGDVSPVPLSMDFTPADLGGPNPLVIVWHDYLTGLPDPSRTMTAGEFMGWQYSAGRSLVARTLDAMVPPAQAEQQPE